MPHSRTKPRPSHGRIRTVWVSFVVRSCAPVPGRLPILSHGPISSDTLRCPRGHGPVTVSGLVARASHCKWFSGPG